LLLEHEMVDISMHFDLASQLGELPHEAMDHFALVAPGNY
jgi:hypothetical protein